MRKKALAIETIVGLLILILSVCLLVKERVLAKTLGDFLILAGFLVVLVIYGLEFRYVTDIPNDRKRGKDGKRKT